MLAFQNQMLPSPLLETFSLRSKGFSLGDSARTEADGIYDAWDGNYHSSPEEIGTYYYIVKYRCMYTGKEYILKGDLTLVR